MEKVQVMVWNEWIHEQENPAIKKLYPQGMHAVISRHLASQPGVQVQTATLDEPEHGLTEAVVAQTDVLIWWGHVAHGKVNDEVVSRVQKRVLEGMGLIVLHSGHMAKIFKRMLGTNCSLKWREADEKERLWNIEPGHPITAGIGEYIELPYEEMYGERFDIPTPDKVIFISWFEGGEVFRSGCCWERGHGRIFYFRPGHEAYPTFYDPQILRVISNAVRWAAPRVTIPDQCPNAKPIETITPKNVKFTHVGRLQNG